MVPESIPQPFKGIARGSLRADPLGRCTLENVKTWLGAVQAPPEAAGKTDKKACQQSAADVCCHCDCFACRGWDFRGEVSTRDSQRQRPHPARWKPSNRRPSRRLHRRRRTSGRRHRKFRPRPRHRNRRPRLRRRFREKPPAAVQVAHSQASGDLATGRSGRCTRQYLPEPAPVAPGLKAQPAKGRHCGSGNARCPAEGAGVDSWQVQSAGAGGGRRPPVMYPARASIRKARASTLANASLKAAQHIQIQACGSGGAFYIIPAISVSHGMELKVTPGGGSVAKVSGTHQSKKPSP